MLKLNMLLNECQKKIMISQQKRIRAKGKIIGIDFQIDNLKGEEEDIEEERKKYEE